MAVTTEQMIRVIAKWQGWRAVDYDMFDPCDPGRFSDAEDYSQIILDPREDTDSALALLHYIFKPNWCMLGPIEDGGWEVIPLRAYSVPVAHRIPAPSGQRFRDAVCELAVRVMEEENKDD